MCLAIAGGALGLGISSVACLALAHWTPIKPMITWSTVLLAFSTCIAIGCFFGLIPAMKAARRDPVEALRNE
jgi:putative ABC transport system permease protein